MTRSHVWRTRFVFAALGVLALVARDARAQHAGHETPPPAHATRSYTMDELHKGGGVPRGWRFALPPGDPAKGRAVFVELECYKCHVVKGAGFPPPGGDAKSVGPELTTMGGMHPAEYLAESVLAPNAVILEGPGFTGPDGRSIMPSYADSLSVAQLLDLVAYLKTLTGDAPGAHAHGAAILERSAGEYVIRVAHAVVGAHGPHARHAPAAPGHLMVFVSDSSTGDAVPYLPVTVTLRGKGGMTPRTRRLVPMFGESGFHYGADVRVPASTTSIVVTIGPTTMRVMPTVAGRFAEAVTVEFEWPGS